MLLLSSLSLEMYSHLIHFLSVVLESCAKPAMNMFEMVVMRHYIGDLMACITYSIQVESSRRNVLRPKNQHTHTMSG